MNRICNDVNLAIELVILFTQVGLNFPNSMH